MRDEAQKIALVRALHLDPRNSLDLEYWESKTLFSSFLLGGSPITLQLKDDTLQTYRVPTGVAELMHEVGRWLCTDKHEDESVEDFAEALEGIRQQYAKQGKSIFRYEATQTLYDTPIKPVISATDIILGDEIEAGNSDEHAKVFKAVYNNTQIAVKTSRDNTEQELLAQFKVVAPFNSPYIVYCYGICEAGLVLESMPLGSLETILSNRVGDFDPKQWSTVKTLWATDIINGLTYLHAQGIVYGNLNPKNILMSSEARLKLADFSHFKIEGEISDIAKDPLYMAPEMYSLTTKGITTIQATRASDIFSYGAVLAKLTSPSNFAKLATSAVTIDFCRSSRSRLLMSPCGDQTLQEIAVACWAPKPEDRPTAQKIVAILDENADAPIPAPSRTPLLGR